MKKNLLQSLAATTLLALCSVAVAQNIAIVNGKPITKAQADAFSAGITAQAKAQNQQLPPDFAQKVKEELINREIFMQEARKRGLDTTDDFKTKLDLARQSVLLTALMEDEKKKAAPTDAEIQAEYDKVANEARTQEYKARHILVDKEDAAKTIIAQIKKIGKFEEIAKKTSKDQGSAAHGGALDWAPATNYVKEFADALTKLEKGKMTDTPVKTQFGYHIIRLDDVRTTQIPPLEQVKPQVKQQLEGKKLTQFQENLRKSAKIE